MDASKHTFRTQLTLPVHGPWLPVGQGHSLWKPLVACSDLKACIQLEIHHLPFTPVGIQKNGLLFLASL